jgi:hypothetical protein
MPAAYRRILSVRIARLEVTRRRENSMSKPTRDDEGEIG